MSAAADAAVLSKIEAERTAEINAAADAITALPMGLKRPEHDHGSVEWSPAQADEAARQHVALKAASPLRGRTDQHDASELGLFRAASEPGLL